LVSPVCSQIPTRRPPPAFPAGATHEVPVCTLLAVAGLRYPRPISNRP
ncbi:adp-ribosylation factor-like protein 2, partial [Nannochloropsis gaditana CCMP526]